MSLHLDEDALLDAVDGRLSGERLAEVQAHLGECGACRRTFDSLRWVKQRAAGAGQVEVPAELSESIAAALDTKERRGAPRWAWTAAVAVVAALGVVLWMRRSSHDLPRHVASDYRSFVAGELPLGLETSDVEQMERFFAANGVGFETRVFDLRMMQLELEGGSVRQREGRSVALFVYRSRDGSRLICQMYEGTLGELPVPEARRRHDGIEFHVHRSGELTIVFWPEGKVVCVLVGAGDPEQVVQLAFAKAVKVDG